MKNVVLLDGNVIFYMVLENLLTVGQTLQSF